MAGVPRSQVLIEVHSTTAGNDGTFQCPPNCVTLVKSLYVHNGDTAQQGYLFRLYVASASWSIPLKQESLQTNTEGAWEGWAVLNPQEYVQIHLNGPNMYAWVSGAVLLGPPPFPPTPGLLPAGVPNPAPFSQ
jgi:hypothetical protein